LIECKAQQKSSQAIRPKGWCWSLFP